MDMPSLQRLTINFVPKASAALASAAERDSLSMTDTLNRAIIMDDLITGYIATGNTVILENADGKQKVLEFL